MHSALKTTGHEHRSNWQATVCFVPEVCLFGRCRWTKAFSSIFVGTCPAVVIGDPSDQSPASTFSRHVAKSLVRCCDAPHLARSLKIVISISTTCLLFDYVPAGLGWLSGITWLDTGNVTFLLCESWWNVAGQQDQYQVRSAKKVKLVRHDHFAAILSGCSSGPCFIELPCPSSVANRLLGILLGAKSVPRQTKSCFAVGQPCVTLNLLGQTLSGYLLHSLPQHVTMRCVEVTGKPRDT